MAQDPDIVFISYDSAKRGAGIPSLMVHSSVPYGIKQMKQGASLQAVQAEMLESLRRVMPALPAPEEVAIYPWEHSQVRYPLDLPDGAACVVLNDVQGAASAPLVLAGDAFSSLGSRFDGCAQSGEHAARALLGASRTQR
uniref:Amine oxidase domain-containing protein n=1 Tax=Chrysotila carterae TaxID=13221 RepID=A0A7S4F1L3_CHRCT